MLHRIGQLALFLVTVSIATAPYTLGLLPVKGAAPPTSLDADVAIVGAGVSGLAAALDLTAKGHSVIVLEALPRLGGRCFRAEAIPGSGVYWDEGGQWVGPTQHRILDLLRHHGLELYDSAHALGSTVLLWEGSRVATNGTCWDCMVLPKEEDPESIDGLLAAVAAAPEELKPEIKELLRVMTQFRSIVDSIDPAQPWNAPNATALDSMSFDEWVREQTDSELARHILKSASRTQGATNSAPTATSALHIARQIRAAPQVDSPERWLIKGAMGQLPALMAAELEEAGGRIVLDSQVVSISQDSDSATIKTANGDVVTAKRVIMTLPPHLAGRVTYSPPLHPARDLLTQRAGMGVIVKCAAVYEKPFWRSEAITTSNGTAVKPLSFVMDPAGPHGPTLGFDISPNGDDGPGVLATFVDLSTSQPWSLTREGRKENVLKAFTRMFGKNAKQPLAYVEKNWAEEPTVGGAYTTVMPIGAWTRFGPALAAPVGAIHWAGTEVSPEWPGFYEGALAAAESAAAAVHAELTAVPLDGVSAEEGVSATA